MFVGGECPAPGLCTVDVEHVTTVVYCEVLQPSFGTKALHETQRECCGDLDLRLARLGETDAFRENWGVRVESVTHYEL